jgi:hypothetical protein
MNNIQESSKKIKNIYDNLTYFDQYGSQVFLFIILSIIVFLVYSYCAVMLNIQPIKDDWANQRCNPKVMPFAGFINKPPGKSMSDFTQENFTYCVQNILKSITGYAVQPITYITSILQNLYLALLKNVQGIRDMLNNVRNSMSALAKEIMGRIMNMMIPLQQIIIGMKDAMGKVQGILTAALFTSLGSYYALKSLMGAIVEFIVIILLVLLALIIVLWILPFTWPFAAVNSAIFLAIAIPLTIIVVFLTQVLGVQSSAVPKLRCFDENTQIELVDNSKISIVDIKVGDKLANGDIVTAKMKVDAANLDMYSIEDVIVSGCHIVKKSEYYWIPVSQHEMSIKIENYDKPYVYCFNTTSKVINISNIVFSDWDEIYGAKLVKMKDIIRRKFFINTSDVKDSDIHKYYDGGFDENTNIVLNNGTIKLITEIQINDILENGERVYALVEIDGTNVNKQAIFNLGENKYFVGGPKLNFTDANLGQTSTLQLNPKKFIVRDNNSEKLYHLVTDKGTFKIGDLIFNDYNSCVDLLF